MSYEESTVVNGITKHYSVKVSSMATAKKEKSNLSKRKGLEVQLRKIYAEFEEKLLTIWSFSTIDNLLDGLSIPSKFLKNSQDASIL